MGSIEAWIQWVEQISCTCKRMHNFSIPGCRYLPNDLTADGDSHHCTLYRLPENQSMTLWWTEKTFRRTHFGNQSTQAYHREIASWVLDAAGFRWNWLLSSDCPNWPACNERRKWSRVEDDHQVFCVRCEYHQRMSGCHPTTISQLSRWCGTRWNCSLRREWWEVPKPWLL